MNRILIVEDELMEREFVLGTIKETVGDAFIVDAFDTAEKALNAFSVNHYDIAFLDVNLPGMSGLELAAHLKSLNPKLKFFIVTSYNYFDYALEAIRLDVSDYLLKPTKKEGIINALNSVLDHRNTDLSPIAEKQSLIRKRNEKELIYALLIEHSDQKILDLAAKLHLKIEGISTLIKSNDEVPMFEESIKDLNLDYLTFEHGSLTIYVFLYEVIEELEAPLGIIVNSEYHNSLSISLNDYFSSIRKNYEIASIYDYQRIVNYYFSEGHKTIMNNNIVSEYISFQLYKKTEKEIYNYIDNLQSTFMETCNQLGVSIPQELILLTRKDFNLNTKLIEIQMLIDRTAKLYIDRIMSISDETHYQISIRVNHYILNNYSKNISLTDMAEDLDISSFQISKVLSNANTSFTEMVNNVRIDKAKELLETDLSIKEITFNVGYRSTTYFARVFKKYVGLTPSQYQQQHSQIEQ